MMERESVPAAAVEVQRAVAALLAGPSAADPSRLPRAQALLQQLQAAPGHGARVGLAVAAGAAQADARFIGLNVLLSQTRAGLLSHLAADEVEHSVAVLYERVRVEDVAVVQARACLALAAVSTYSGNDQHLDSLLDFAFTKARQPLPKAQGVAFHLLTAVGEEVLHRGRAHDPEYLEYLQETGPDLLALMEEVLPSEDTSRVEAHVVSAVLQCLHTWLQSGITLSEISNDHPHLLAVLLHAVTSEAPEVRQHAAEVLSELVTLVDPMPGRTTAVERVMERMVTIQNSLPIPSNGLGADYEEPSNVRYAMGTVVCALVAAEASLIAQGGVGAEGTMACVVQCSQHAPAALCEQAFSAFVKLGLVPEEKWAEGWRTTLFQAAWGAALQRTTQGAADLDDTDSMREGVVGDLIAVCHNILGLPCHTQLISMLQTPPSQGPWEVVEVALFATRALYSTKTSPAGPAQAHPLDESSVVARDVLAAAHTWTAPCLTEQYMGSIIFHCSRNKGRSVVLNLSPSFSEILTLPYHCGQGCGAQAAGHAGLFVNSVLRALGVMSDGLTADLTLLGAAASYCIEALQLEEARSEAVETLNGLCTEAARRPEVARALLTSLSGMTLPSNQLDPPERASLMQAFTTVAAALPAHEAWQALKSLASTPIDHIAQALPHAVRATQQNAAITSELLGILDVLVAELHMLEAWVDRAAPMSLTLLEEPNCSQSTILHPVLDIVHSCTQLVGLQHSHIYKVQQTVQLADAVCAVWRKIAIECGWEESQVITADCAKNLAELYLQTGQPSALSSLASIVDICGSWMDHSSDHLPLRGVLGKALPTIFGTVVDSLQKIQESGFVPGTSDLQNVQPLFQSPAVLFELASMCITRCPTLTRSHLLPAFVKLVMYGAETATNTQDGEVACAALVFMACTFEGLQSELQASDPSRDTPCQRELLPLAQQLLQCLRAVFIAVARPNALEQIYTPAARTLLALCGVWHRSGCEEAALHELSKTIFSSLPHDCATLQQVEVAAFARAVLQQPPERTVAEMLRQFRGVCLSELAPSTLQTFH